MPELPDLAVFGRYIERTALPEPIIRTSVTDERILEDISIQALSSRLKDRRLTSTHRHGKCLFIEADRAGWLVMHFGMTGKLAYYKNGDQPEHTRLLLTFENGYHLAYQSQRMLGRVTFTKDLDGFVSDHDLGPDALCDELDVERFRELLGTRRGAVKTTLMNQSVLAGIGNVYADEILFQAGIHPKAHVDELDDHLIDDLYHLMRQVLHTAAESGADIDRLPDDYLLKHRENGSCPRCNGPITKQTVGGRSSYFCARCQPSP